MSKKSHVIKCLQEISGLSDLTVIKGNIKWCQNEPRTQNNSLLLTIGKGNDWNIIKYHGDFSGNFTEGHDNLGSHMVGWQTLQLENFNLNIAKCNIDSIIII